MKKARRAGQMYFRHLHKCAISLKGTTVLGFATMSAEAAEGAEEKSKGHAGQKQRAAAARTARSPAAAEEARTPPRRARPLCC